MIKKRQVLLFISANFHGRSCRNQSRQGRFQLFRLHRFDVLIQVADAQLDFGCVSLAHMPEKDNKSAAMPKRRERMKSNDDKVLTNVVGRASSGEGAHAASQNVFDGLDWKVAAVRPPGVPHSIFQLLAHTSYWQNWALQ